MKKGLRFFLSLLLMVAMVFGMAGCNKEEPQEWTKRSTMTFGRYPQTEEGSDETPIEWIVLEVDEENHRALLISKYGLDTKPYNKEWGDITWGGCILRVWLNYDFANRAFSPEEQAAILLTDVDNSDAQGYSGRDTTGGNNTQDYIFLLSYAEANRYFNVEHISVSGSGYNTLSRVTPTAYAIKQGAWTSSDYETADGSAAGWWWLRSPGFSQNWAACVSDNGSLSENSTDILHYCVRPAMWVDLSLIPSAP